MSQAIQKARQAGIPIFAAANNDGFDTDQIEDYPCCYDGVTCVSATNNNYGRPIWAGYGKCVDFVAPGDSIAVADFENNNEMVYKSGTSEANAHASGIAAIYTYVSSSIYIHT